MGLSSEFNQLNQEERKYVNQLYKQHRRFVYNVVKSIVGECCDIEDIVQEIFMKMIVSRLFRRFLKENAKYYLYKMAYYQSLDFLQQRQKERNKVKVFLEEEVNEATSVNNINEFWNHIEVQEYIKLFDQLPEVLFDTMKFRYVEELSIKEISNILCISELVVRKRLQRGREKLKEICNEKEGT